MAEGDVTALRSVVYEFSDASFDVNYAKSCGFAGNRKYGQGKFFFSVTKSKTTTTTQKRRNCQRLYIISKRFRSLAKRLSITKFNKKKLNTLNVTTNKWKLTEQTKKYISVVQHKDRVKSISFFSLVK